MIRIWSILKLWQVGVHMEQIDMSAKAITARLRLISELRRLCLSLNKAKLPTKEETGKRTERSEAAQSETRKAK